jgi:hypothetical protein
MRADAMLALRYATAVARSRPGAEGMRVCGYCNCRLQREHVGNEDASPLIVGVATANS